MPALYDAEVHFGMPAVLTLIVAVAVVTFLTFYYLINKSTRENHLLAKISQLDAQLYESQAAHQEFGAVQGKLSEHETEVSQLKALNDQLNDDKTELEVELIRAKRENESLAKELESATESGLELNQMLNDVLASQAESSELQRSVEALEQQLSKQHAIMENQQAALAAKAAENQLLAAQAEQLNDNLDKFQVRLKTQQSDLETLKTSNRNYLQKLTHDEAELSKLKQERDGWTSERRSLANQLGTCNKETAALKEKLEQLTASIKTKDEELKILGECVERLNDGGDGGSGGGAHNDANRGELSSLLEFGQLKAQLSAARQDKETVDRQLVAQKELWAKCNDDKDKLELQLKEWQQAVETAVKNKHESETRLGVSAFDFLKSLLAN